MQEQIIAYLQSLSLGEWAGIGLLGVVAFRQRALIGQALSWVKLKFSSADEKETDEEDLDFGPADAFAAAQLLIFYFEEVGCEQGVEAARSAGQCLFHKPSEH